MRATTRDYVLQCAEEGSEEFLSALCGKIKWALCYAGDLVGSWRGAVRESPT